MLIRQSKNTFIRSTDQSGYITSQLTYHDRVYNDTGADYLRALSREPQQVDDIVNKVLPLYADVDFQTLKEDFVEFAQDLANAKFLVIGNTIEELDANDLDFSYSLENPKTMVEDFTQHTTQEVKENTQDYFLEGVQKRPLISALQFELTSRCNERCIHCYIPNQKKDAGNDMSYEQACNLLDEFAAMGGLHITLSGGEAFMHKDILRIIAYCREKDLKISILSNLIALKDVHIPFIKAANISLIQVSLYSMEPEVHDKITAVRGSFVKTKAAIEKLVAADIPVQISCPVMRANAKGYDDVMRYADSLKVKATTDYIMMAQSDLDTSNLANRISLEETETLLKDILTYDKDYTDITLQQQPIVSVDDFDYERFAKQPVCGVGLDNCCITENGDVYPCAGWQDMVLGNINEQSLQEIWDNSPKIKELRAITQASFPKCIRCEARNYCAMCMVRNYNESGGDMFKINEHFCKVAFLNKKVVEEYYADLAKN